MIYLKFSDFIVYIIILAVIISAYILLVLISFIFMVDFKEKINRSRKTIDITLFQRKDEIARLAKHLGLNDLAKKCEEFEFKNLKIEEYSKIFNSEEEDIKTIKKYIVNNSINDEKVLSKLKILDQLNFTYVESCQLYNTYVVGYNYWRNLFSTKWIKKLFKIQEIESIK